MLAREGYQHRRAWLAWHIALLTRIPPRDFPDLEDLTGEAEEREPPSPEEQVRTLRMWNMVVNRKATTS